jgi:hypothetical protein
VGRPSGNARIVGRGGSDSWRWIGVWRVGGGVGGVGGIGGVGGVGGVSAHYKRFMMMMMIMIMKRKKLIK